MNMMFYNCYSLQTLNLNNFDTSSVLSMIEMFSDCKSLKTLYIDNFNLSKAYDISYIFYNCSSLISLNLTNFDSQKANFDNMVEGCNKKLKYCLDEKRNYKFINLLKNFEKNCKDICIVYNDKKYIVEENKCLDNCTLDQKYKYEYNDFCYEKCPDNTELVKGSNYLCKDNYGEEEENTILVIVIVIVVLIIIIIIVVIFIIYRKRIFEYCEKIGGKNNDDKIIPLDKEIKD